MIEMVPLAVTQTCFRWCVCFRHPTLDLCFIFIFTFYGSLLRSEKKKMSLLIIEKPRI